MKVKLFTHTDLDGISCAILAKIAFKDEVDIEYCNYNDIDSRFKDFWFGDKLSNYDQVFITDISISEELAVDINISYLNSATPHLTLLDHHKTAEYLNKYSWAIVKTVNYFETKISGTYMLYCQLFYKLNSATKLYNNIETFCEIVRKYDTWEWTNVYKDIIPKQFNDLLYIYGRDRFIDLMISKIQNDEEFGLTSENIQLLELEQEKITRYIEAKNKTLIKTKIDGLIAGIVFAENFISQLGDELCKLNLDIDFVMIVNIDKVASLRTIKDIDVSEIAKKYGGGGHLKAAGIPLIKELREEIVKQYFSH